MKKAVLMSRLGLSITVVVWAATAAVSAPAWSQRAAAFDRGPWLADLHALRDALTRDYANLEWAVERGMNLPAVEARARARLAVATNDQEARAALELFVRAFGDGHLKLTWPRREVGGASTDLGSTSVCQRLGFRDGPDDYTVAARLPGYRPLDPADPTAAGTVELAGATAAVLRIEEFNPSVRQCSEVLAGMKLPPTGACDAACGERVRERAGRLFVVDIERRLRALAALKTDLLLVDLATNGGGDDSSVALARVLGGDLPTPPVARLRGVRLATDIAEKRMVLHRAAAKLSTTDAASIRRLEAELGSVEADARRSCDRSPLWRGEKIDCSGTVRGPFFAGGLSARSLDVEVDSEAAAVLSSTAHYTYSTGLWRGPIALLVDGNTASSAELVAAMLQDARRAIIAGSPTFGAGCGWMLEPEPTLLPNSGGHLRMPDCVRYRADGSNEVDGVTPDVAVGFRRNDTAKQRVARLTAAWPQVVARAMSGR